MAVAYSAALTFKRRYARGRSSIYYAPDLASVEIFAAKLQELSDAAINKITFVATEPLTNTENPNDVQFTIAHRAIFRLKRHTYDPAQSNYREVHVLAPKSNIVEYVDGKGYRVKQTIGDQVADAYSEMTGTTYDFDGGWLCGGFKNDWDSESGG